jgi:hypothetical protein
MHFDVTTSSLGGALRALVTCSTLAAAAAGCTTGGPGDKDGGPGTSTGSTGQSACAVTAGDVEISAGEGGQPVVVWTGDGFAMAWTSFAKDAGDIHFALVDAKGAKKTQQVIHEAVGESKLPSIVRLSGGGYLVLWQDADGTGSIVRGRRVAEDGSPQGVAFQLTTTGSAEARPAVGSAAGSVFAAWMDASSAFVGALANDAIGPKSSVAGGYPALGGSDVAMGLAWTTGSQLAFSTISAQLGGIQPTLFRDASGNANVPRLAPGAANSFLLAWEDSREGEGNENVFLTQIGPDGSPGGEISVPSEGGSANYPDVVDTGANVAVVYYQFRDGPPSIYLSLFGADLTRSAEDLQISGNAAAKAPRAAWGDGRLAVAYAEPDGPVKIAIVECP